MQYSFEHAHDLVQELEEAWVVSDRLFGLCGEAWLERPIPFRHPFIFYLGHLPAFAWNQLGRGALGEPPINAAFEELFERGIDPGVGGGALPRAEEAAWPSVDRVLRYVERVRAALRECSPRVDQRVVAVVLEHELMHHETLTYMLRELEHARKPAPPVPTTTTSRREVANGWIEVPPGVAPLGADRDELPFGWDNEFPQHPVPVEAFELRRLPVTVLEFLEFLEQDGYRQRRHWTDEGWEHLRASGDRHPHGWSRRGAAWCLRGCFEDHLIEDVGDWPVMVTQVEAAAYASWRGAQLPSEAELQRAAYGAPDGDVRPYPWGPDRPTPQHGNFGLQRLDPVPVGHHPAGESAWGALELVGNGWEWTRTEFGPLPGFEASTPNYPGYSADFFGGGHNVVFGAAWATHPRLLRRSFRNWYQRRYPYATATFRLSRPVSSAVSSAVLA